MGRPPDDGSRRVGRPARIDHDDIARAVLEIGFEAASMRRVAEHLGVSVPGLYYYVKGRDDLLRVAARYTLERAPLPVDRGQHWAEWLREWARYTRASFSEPEMLEHYVAGALDDARMVVVVGEVLDVMRDRGWDGRHAMAAYDAVITVALGSVVDDLRDRHSTEAGTPWPALVHATLAQRDATELAALRDLVARGIRPDRDAAFEERLTTMLVGLATRFDLPIDDVVRGSAPRSRKTRTARKAR